MDPTQLRLKIAYDILEMLAEKEAQKPASEPGRMTGSTTPVRSLSRPKPTGGSTAAPRGVAAIKTPNWGGGSSSGVAPASSTISRRRFGYLNPND